MSSGVFEVLVVIAFTTVAGLIGVIYKLTTARLDRLESQIFERLRSLGHEDRSIRDDINSLVTTIMQTSGDEKQQMSRSLDLIANVFSHYGAIQRGKLKDE